MEELQLHSKTILREVLQLNEDEEPGIARLQCQNCNFNTSYFHLLLPHLASHSKHEEEKVSTVEPLSSPNLKLECTECGKIFKKAEVLEAHMKREHQGNTTPWECDQCGKGFTRKASLEEHRARHLGKKQRHCASCDKYFYDTAYWRHQAIVHPEKEKLRHPCPHCDRVFSQKFKLDVHMQSHMNYSEKKFRCEHCPDKRFASSEKLRNHTRVVHASKVAGSHLCGTCGATFPSYPSLYQHDRRVHGEEEETEEQKLVTCSRCNLNFATEADLESHVTNMHSRQPFICGFQDCDLDFSSIASLQHHQVAQHQGEVEEEEGDQVIYMGDIIEEREDEVDTVVVEHQSEGNLELQLYARDEEDDGKVEDQKKLLGEQVVNIDINEENTIILTSDQGQELIKALSIEMGDSNKMFPCSFCTKVYRSERSRTVHVKSIHLQTPMQSLWKAVLFSKSIKTSFQNPYWGETFQV